MSAGGAQACIRFRKHVIFGIEAYVGACAQPVAALLSKKGELIGTAALGGVEGCADNQGCGTVFEIDPASGDLTTLFEFPADSSDGKFPEGSLISEKGELFGTTSVGGIVDGEPQYGTVFELDPDTQALTTLHVFTGEDGEAPVAGLVSRRARCSARLLAAARVARTTAARCSKLISRQGR